MSHWLFDRLILPRWSGSPSPDRYHPWDNQTPKFWCNSQDQMLRIWVEIRNQSMWWFRLCPSNAVLVASPWPASSARHLHPVPTQEWWGRYLRPRRSRPSFRRPTPPQLHSNADPWCLRPTCTRSGSSTSTWCTWLSAAALPPGSPRMQRFEQDSAKSLCPFYLLSVT